MATDSEYDTCLDVAIDHRIRRLFKPVKIGRTPSSNHLRPLVARGESLGRSTHEINVTKQLAGPRKKGGIAIVLQQPRDNHPFKEGIDTVIGDCDTLYALFEIFTVASCNTLDIRSNVAVIDLLPYMPEKVEEISDYDLSESFDLAAQVICDKEPDILLCAGKIWLPRAGKTDTRKGDTWRFESIGIGETFGSKPTWPEVAKVRSGERGFVSVRRVNGFHPSHAINYNSHISVLRQLQILIGAETCGRFRGDWREEDWMKQLRRRCKNLASATSGPSSQSSTPQSPDRSPGRRNSNRYIPEYQELYADKLLELQNRAYAAMEKPEYDSDTRARVIYHRLLDLDLTALCNDASLILRQMLRLQRKGWPQSVATRNESALQEAAVDTFHFAKFIHSVAKEGTNAQITKIFRRRAKSVLRHCSADDGKKGPNSKLDMEGACNAFLSLATDIESLLLNLLLESEKAPLVESEDEDHLLSEMSRLTLDATRTTGSRRKFSLFTGRH